LVLIGSVAFVTILPTIMWNQFRKFDRHDIMAAHSITKRDAGVLYRELRKIHYNVMRFPISLGHATLPPSTHRNDKTFRYSHIGGTDKIETID
jgi:hypothetical protein